MRMRILVVPALVAGALLAPGVAAASGPVGTPGTPTCFGERISHGSSDHKLTPKERAARLQVELVDAGIPEAVAFFGPTVEVREMILFVRINCSDDPLVPSGP